MTKREAVSRYYLIIKALRKHSVSFNEINDYLLRESEIQGYDYGISKRTFLRDIIDIRSIYDIDIQFDHSRNVYYIDEEQSEACSRILEAFDILNAFNLSESLSDYIYFEKRHPQGTEHLNHLLDAIKNRKRVSFIYLKFWDESASQRKVEPYALKEFKSRWYVLAKDLKDQHLKTFGLDRISNLEITKEKFQFPADFNVNEYYHDYFGIISDPDVKPQTVILSLDPLQGRYIKSLPLHESQQVVSENEQEVRIKLKVCVTYDFIMEILSLGDRVTVIKPESLINRLQSIYKNTLKHYHQ